MFVLPTFGDLAKLLLWHVTFGPMREFARSADAVVARTRAILAGSGQSPHVARSAWWA